MGDDEGMIEKYPLFVDGLRMWTGEAQALEWEILLGRVAVAGIGGGLFMLLCWAGSSVSTIIGLISLACGLGAVIGLIAG